MAWQDRDFNRRPNYSSGPPPGSGTGLGFLWQLFMGSLSLGKWFGIEVRVHASLLWFIGLRLLYGMNADWKSTLISSGLLFAIVLLHEFGHCIGAISVGGRADHILLWPLGGLAYTDTENTIWARFVTVAAGPFVNVIICAVAGSLIWFQFHSLPPFNPLYAFLPINWTQFLNANPQFVDVLLSDYGLWLWWIFNISFMLLFFNLIPMYPLDGGKLAQILLWKFIGYRKSMHTACVVGMFGAVAMGLFGLLKGTFFLVVLAAFGFMDCYNQRRMLQFEEANGDDQYDLSAAHEEPARKRKRGWFGNRWAKAAAKRAEQDRKEQEQIDAILAKVSEKGLHSLSSSERKALKRATEKQRQRDLADRL